jgi:hypothetical protein
MQYNQNYNWSYRLNVKLLEKVETEGNYEVHRFESLKQVLDIFSLPSKWFLRTM